MKDFKRLEYYSEQDLCSTFAVVWVLQMRDLAGVPHVKLEERNQGPKREMHNTGRSKNKEKEGKKIITG